MQDPPIARNAPCPCGSGRKYKRCCGEGAPTQWSGDSLWHRMRRAEGHLVPEIGAWAHARYGPELIDEAWLDFLFDERCDDEDDLAEDRADHSECGGLFIPWYVFRWIPRESAEFPEPGPIEPLGLAFLAADERRLDPLERRFLAAACESPTSFHQVLDVDPGRSLHLRDLLTGEEHRVSERSASTRLARGAILFARVVALDDVALILGSGSYVIPPGFAHGLLGLRDELAGRPGPLSREDAWRFDDALRLAYLDIVAELEDPTPPRVVNADGDPVVLTELRYSLACPPARALEALLPLAPGYSEAECLAQSEFDPRGELTAAALPWLRRTRRDEPEEDGVLGWIEIAGAALTAHTDSRRRSQRLQDEIARRLGNEATLEEEQATDPLAAEGPDEEPPLALDPRELTPEVQEQLAEMRRDYWERWLDEELPALGGLTPRAAAREPRAREDLETLLLQFEWVGEDTPNALAPDVPALRRALGL